MIKSNKKQKILFFFLIFICQLLHTNVEMQEKQIVVVTASYNNKEWYQKNLDSFFSQDYKSARMIYIDDCSTDGTTELVEAYIAQNGFEDRITLIKNDQRCGHLANQYNAIHSCHNEDIIVILDGDDWFAHNHVLSYINNVYSDPTIWMTFGQFKFLSNGRIPRFRHYSEKRIKNNDFRKDPFYLSHLRTFYAGLFKKIKRADLIYEDDFFKMAADRATMYPMIEMASKGHFKLLDEVLLIYNNKNSLNCLKTARRLCFRLTRYIQKQPKYEPIETYK